MNLKNYLDIAPEVKSAVEAGKPVVALESTILSHGMPYPENLTFAAEVERIIRAEVEKLIRAYDPCISCSVH